MRTTPLLVAFVLAACSPSDQRSPAAAGAIAAPHPAGPDALVFRVPRGGGIAHVSPYPAMDSAVWASSGFVPPLARVLAFDEEAGSIAATDSTGSPVRIDLRLTRVSRNGAVKLASLASADGWAVYGVQDRAVRRLTPEGEAWLQPVGERPTALFPATDGSVVIAASSAMATRLWRARPPARRLADSVLLPAAILLVATPLGDRIYLATESGLLGVRSRDFALVNRLAVRTPVLAAVPSPSGDRLFVLGGDGTQIEVVDRYRDAIETTIILPGAASALRIDPLGRLLLVRAAHGDSAWVVAVSSERLVGAVQTAWREDLPAVAPDAALALLRGADVVLEDADHARPSRTVAGGAADLWHFLLWNGFRPRAHTTQEPVQFATSAADSSADAAAVAGATPKPPADLGGRVTAPAASSPAAAPAAPFSDASSRLGAGGTRGFTVSFAAVLTSERAVAMAKEIKVGSEQARVLVSKRDTTTVFRVVLGPYASKAEADRIGRDARRDYWIFEGNP